MRIPILIPDAPLTAEALPYLQRIDQNRVYTNFGPLVQELEARLTGFVSASGKLHPANIVTVSSATSGISLALSALGRIPGGKVLVPALTFVGTVSAIVAAGFEPLYCDVDDQSWLLGPEHAQDIVGSRTDIVAVVPVCAFGAPVDGKAWDGFSERTGIKVVIDAAGAFGNQQVDCLTPVVFSMHATKALGCGEGGFVASLDPHFVSRVRSMSNFGFGPDRTAHCIGINAKMSEYHAAFGLAALDRWPDSIARRNILWENWKTAFRPLTESGLIGLQAGAEHRLHTILPVRIALCGKEDVADIVSSLAGQGVETRRWYVPLVKDHPGYQCFGVAEDLRHSVPLSRELIGLPFHPALTKEDFTDIQTRLAQLL